MEIKTTQIELETRGNTDILNISDIINKTIEKEGFVEGQVFVSVTGSTAGISTLEYEPGLVKHDVSEMLQKIAPYGVPYTHNKTWGDDNGCSHLRSFLIKTSQSFPFYNGRLLLGTWQQIVLVDFDTRPRHRTVVIQLIGT